MYLNALRQRPPREASPLALEILKTALIEAAQVRNPERNSWLHGSQRCIEWVTVRADLEAVCRYKMPACARAVHDQQLRPPCDACARSGLTL